MKLEEIGFYTLSDARARAVSWKSDMQRCELILTDRCNFKCAYCRGVKKEFQGDLTLDQAKEVVDTWASGSLHNIRFSGGEPTVWKGLLELVSYTKSKPSIQHIAISTNGSASLSTYLALHASGVNDFSISLDACCAMTADTMAGTNSRFDHISMVIRELSLLTYVTVGVVIDERNNDELNKIIEYATSLGVADIRIIPSAQSNHHLSVSVEASHPILKYRVKNLEDGIHVRGLRTNDTHKCHLVKDDMVILGGNHFPCVIYMREQGDPTGSVADKSLEEIREERRVWFEKTDTHSEKICSGNCLDVCVSHNNRVRSFQGE